MAKLQITEKHFEKVKPVLPSPGVLEQPEYSHRLTVFCPPQNAPECKSIFSEHQAIVIINSTMISSDNKEAAQFIVLAKKSFVPELESALYITNCMYTIRERSPEPPEGCGTGRYGKLKTPIKLSDAVDSLKSLVGMPQIRMALETGKTLDSEVTSVAVVAGSGSSVLRGVQADLYVTGEMLHHDLLEAIHSNATVVLLNHSDSERGYLTEFAEILSEHFTDRLLVSVSSFDKDPIDLV